MLAVAFRHSFVAINIRNRRYHKFSNELLIHNKSNFIAPPPKATGECNGQQHYIGCNRSQKNLDSYKLLRVPRFLRH